MKVFKFISLLFFSLSMHGQNLVPNSSFEDYNTCPESSGIIEYAPPWMNPNSKSPDLYNVCVGAACENPPFVCVPDNWAGSQDPATGDGYAGIFVGGGNINREYIQVPLLGTLIAGESYILTFYLSLGDGYENAIDRMGAYFSSIAIFDSGLLNYTPQITSPANLFFTDKEGWMQFKDTLVAEGGEAFMTIGNFNDEANTTYTLAGGGDRASAYYYIDDVQLIPINQTVTIQGDTSICLGDTTILTALNGTEYEWVDLSDKTTILSTEASLIVAPTETRTYEVSVNAIRANITVSVMGAPELDLGQDTTLCKGESLLLDASAMNTNYLWQDNSTQSTFSVTEEGIYSVEAINDCGISFDELLVEYEDCICALYFPTVFSPNNDGRNDHFSPFFKCEFEKYEFMIFDRWGEQVFESKDPNKAWDGTFLGKEMPSGVYIFQLRFLSKETNKIIETGAFTLLR